MTKVGSGENVKSDEGNAIAGLRIFKGLAVVRMVTTVRDMIYYSEGHFEHGVARLLTISVNITVLSVIKA